jgi:pSer/pThr/pTyr-binding forkhead associated (FHA) protein
MDVKLTVEKGARKKQEIRLKSEDTIIGRRAGCDLRVPSASVSRRHCRLSFHDDCLVVEDLQSANGTYLNGVRIKDTQPVRPGDRLEVGPVTFLVEYQSPAGDSEAGEVLELDVEEIVPEIDLDLDEAEEQKPKKNRKKTVAEPKAGKKKSAAEAPPEIPAKKSLEKPADEPQEEEENLPIAFDESSWHMPVGEDIRDILSQMDDS